jgi:Raf kinase inhibitor-like YbhB/YbcL family protein
MRQGKQEDLDMALILRSPAFQNDREIPIVYTGEGENISPPLEWSNVPRDVREFVLICDDPDNSGDNEFVHWLAYRISPETTMLPAGVVPTEQLLVPVRMDQGRNSAGKIGYVGPLPPVGHGVHHYVFKLFALNEELGTPPGANRSELENAMEGHIVDAAQLIGKYERQSVRRAA